MSNTWMILPAACLAFAGICLILLIFHLQGMAAYEKAHAVHGLCHDHADGDRTSLAHLEPARPADPPYADLLTNSHTLPQRIPAAHHHRRRPHRPLSSSTRPFRTSAGYLLT